MTAHNLASHSQLGGQFFAIHAPHHGRIIVLAGGILDGTAGSRPSGLALDVQEHPNLASELRERRHPMSHKSTEASKGKAVVRWLPVQV